MGTFTIWALVSTILFVLYMGTNIVLDMKGVAKDKNGRVEEFRNVDSGPNEEDSTVVEEDYLESGENPLNESTPPTLPDENQPYSDAGMANNRTVSQEDQRAQAYADEQESMYSKLKQQAENNLETVLPSYQEELSSQEFQIAMSQPLPQESHIEMKTLTC